MQTMSCCCEQTGSPRWFLRACRQDGWVVYAALTGRGGILWGLSPAGWAGLRYFGLSAERAGWKPAVRQWVNTQSRGVRKLSSQMRQFLFKITL
jgi:hypothetical protein